MAFSPCPRCQDKETFDDMMDDTSCAVSEVGYVVQKTPRKDNESEYFCNRNKHHVWSSFDVLHRELRGAGYGL